jgi:hypothetical protein
MDKKLLLGTVVGLMIAVAVVYAVETIDEVMDEDMIKGPFFLLVTISYILVAVWLLKTDSNLPYIITVVGSIGVFILYFVTRTDMAIVFGMEAGRIGHLGIASKVLQIGVIIGALLALYQNIKTRPTKQV